MNDFLNRAKEIASKAKDFMKITVLSAKDFAGKTFTSLKGKIVRQKPVRKYSGTRRRTQAANTAQVVYRPSAQRVVMRKSKRAQRDVVALAKERLTAVKEKMNYKRAAVAMVIAFMCIVTPVVAVIATNNGQEEKLLPEAQAVAMAETQQPTESASETKADKKSEEESRQESKSAKSSEEGGDVTASAVVQQQSDAEQTPAADTEEKQTDEKQAEEEKKEETVLQEGVDSPEVAKLQARLMELDYMEEDEPTEHFGPITAYAVQLFQRKHDLQIDGIAGGETLKLIYAEDAKHYTVSEGVNGTDVEELQKRLAELGYLTSGATGYFGTDTSKAVEAFQKRNNLDVDGNVGSATREALYSEDAIKAPEPEPEPTATESKKTEKKESSSSKKNNSSKKESSSSSKKKNTSSKKNNSSKKEKSTTKVPNDKSVSSLIKVAKQQLGKKYVRGGKGPDVFDCSGFVYYCLNQAGYKIGYMTSAGWAGSSYAKVTSLSDMKKGDILCFKGHVGIYLGGGQMIDASSSQGKIRITGNLGKSSYWKRNFICGRRVLVK